MNLKALQKNYSEEEIIRGCQKGQDKFREMLYKQHYGFGISVCLRYNSNREDAAEILNDSFMKVFQHIEDYRPDKPFRAWFRRILVNTCISHFRANFKKQEFYFLDNDWAEAGSQTYFPIHKLEAQDILKLLGELPEQFRVVFNLYEVEGFSHEEIAAMMDISPGTSRSNLSRGKKMLRSLYEKHFGVSHSMDASVL